MPCDCAHDTRVTESVEFPSGPYWLAGELAYPETGQPIGVAVVAGPHPLLGGTMDNNVVAALAGGLAERGWATLRFDYRGAGGSEGPVVDVAANMARFWETSHVDDELERGADVEAAVRFMREAIGAAVPLVLIGYSFGCALLPTEAREPAALVLVAPTVATHDYSEFARVTMPTLIVVSDDDFANDTERLDQLFRQLRGEKRLVRQRLDNHFFRGHEPWLVQTISDFLETHGR